MTAKEYLSQYKYLQREISRLQQRIDEIRANTMQARAIDYSKPRVEGGGGGDLVLKMVELQEELNERRIAKAEKERIIRRQIDAMPDRRHALILQARYVDGMMLADIAAELDYSFSHVARLHGEALIAFEDLYLKDDKQ